MHGAMELVKFGVADPMRAISPTRTDHIYTGYGRSSSAEPDVGRVTFVNLPNEAGLTAEIFSRVAARRIVVDDIIQNIHDQGRRLSVSFTVDKGDIGESQVVGELLVQQHGGGAEGPLAPRVEVDDGLSKVSIVGVGMRSHSGVAARMFDALAGAKIPIENVSTSEIVVSVLVRRESGEKALAAVHGAFSLEGPAKS